MRVIAIDPGTTESAILYWDGETITRKEILTNTKVLRVLRGTIYTPDVRLAIEMVASYGMAVGKTVFETVFWIGKFHEACQSIPEERKALIYRMDVKMHHCKSARAKDSNIRQALIDRFGPPGVKKAPGLTYGIKKDLWSAFAIATYYYDTHKDETAM